MSKNFDAIRAQLASEITQAENEKNYPKIVQLCDKFIDAFPEHLHPVEMDVRDAFRKKRCAAMDALTSKCPVCGGEMYRTLCPDDIIRSECPACKRTYNPWGYSDDPNFGKKWICIDWSEMVEKRSVIEV